MSHSNRHNLKPRRSEPGILSNVFSFVSREIGEFVINATGKDESGLSKLKHGRDAKLEERGRQRKGYDGGMIEQWREASGSVDDGGEIQSGKTKDRRKSSADGRGRTRRGKETNDGKRRATSRSPSPQRTNHSRGGKTRPPPPLHPSPPISAEAAYPQLRKKPSITMPGSLFPRSDSLEPGPDDRVQDKEERAVRRETGATTETTGDGDRERNEERIRMLEEEVRMLKEELSHRHRSPPPFQTQTQVLIPPPPPPPPLPPPPGVRIPLPPHQDQSRVLFASARAALRPTEGSTTGSTNEITRSASGKVRHPTVNVPSDKMAAFLNEMRTVRLRKVGPIPEGMNRSISDRPAGDRPGPSGLSRSVSSGASGAKGRREEVTRRKSMGVNVPIGSAASNPGPSRLASSSSGSKPASTSKIPPASSIPKPTSTSTASKFSYPPPSSNVIDPRIKNKRKADALGESEGGSTSKRRSGTRDQARSDTSASSSSSSRTHEFSSGSTHSNLSLTNLSLPNPSSLSNETDITTPSLCSDNELGGDDGRMPSTPPGPRSAAAQNAHDEGIEIIDVDMEDIDVEPAHKHVTPSRSQGDMFRKRPPMSPLPVPTPTRVRAPARAKGRKSVPTPERTKRGATPKPKSIMLLDEDDDDDEDGEEEPDELALPPKLTWRREAQPRVTEKSTAANSKGKRRLTLDEELARARSSDRLVELGLESGELVGMGTGSKRRGFLAGGGAGGAPVFMGVGYVRDVEEDGLRQPMSRIPRRRG